jgi:hypothetical protein
VVFDLYQWYYFSMNKNRLIISILIIVIGLGFLYYKEKNKDTYHGPENTGFCGSNGEFCPGTPGYEERMKKEQLEKKEESPNEIFNRQPGEIKSVTKRDQVWIVSVDLLTHNPKWLPGDDSRGEFFINQNNKLRDLTITNTTKAYACGSGSNGELINISEDIQVFMDTFNSEGYMTRYFDIVGTNVVSIYEQCLP